MLLKTPKEGALPGVVDDIVLLLSVLKDAVTVPNQQLPQIITLFCAKVDSLCCVRASLPYLR